MSCIPVLLLSSLHSFRTTVTLYPGILSSNAPGCDKSNPYEFQALGKEYYCLGKRVPRCFVAAPR